MTAEQGFEPRLSACAGQSQVRPQSHGGDGGQQGGREPPRKGYWLCRATAGVVGVPTLLVPGEGDQRWLEVTGMSPLVRGREGHRETRTATRTQLENEVVRERLGKEGGGQDDLHHSCGGGHSGWREVGHWLDDKGQGQWGARGRSW